MSSPQKVHLAQDCDILQFGLSESPSSPCLLHVRPFTLRHMDPLISSSTCLSTPQESTHRQANAERSTPRSRAGGQQRELWRKVMHSKLGRLTHPSSQSVFNQRPTYLPLVSLCVETFLVVTPEAVGATSI